MGFNKVFSVEEQARLKKLVDEGCQVLYEVETLNEGLNETVKAIAHRCMMTISSIRRVIL